MLALLRSVWDEPRPPHVPPRGWRDWALVGTLVPIALLEGVLRPDLPLRVISVIVTVALVATLLWRRSRPLLMIVIAFGTADLAPLLLGGGSPETYTMVYMLLLPYSLFRWGSGREAVIGGLMLPLVQIGLLLFSDDRGADLFGGLTVLVVALAVGVAFRYRASARMRELDQVKLLERVQLARDLHDTVAHHVSAMAIRAQAGLATSASHPDAATDALRVIEAEASRALAEMHTVVRALRQNQPADRSPGRGITDLERLAGRGRPGPPVDVRVSGDLDDIPPSVGAAIYRLAQEAITNARRHARHATRIEVRVTADDTSVHLCVRDDGDGGHTSPATSPGYGLIGMIERAGLLGGTCEAGPNSDRGWTVTAVLPRTGPAT